MSEAFVFYMYILTGSAALNLTKGLKEALKANIK